MSTPMDAAPKLPGKAIMPLLSLKRHWLVSALILGAFVAAGSFLGTRESSPVYYAEAVLHINFRFAANLTTHQEIETHSESQYHRLVEQQTKTINRYDIVQKGLESLGDRRSIWQKPDESDNMAIRRMQGALRIIPISDTYLVTVGLEMDNAESIPLLINPIVAAYLEEHRREVFYGSDIRIDNLSKKRDELLGEIDANSEKLKELADELGLTTFEERFMNPYDQILVTMNESLASAWRERVAAEAELEALKRKQDVVRNIDLGSEAEKIAANDRALGDLRTYLYQRRSQLIELMSGLRPDHPGRRASEREIEEIEAEIDAATVKTRAEIKAILEERRDAEIATELADFEARVDRALQFEDALATEVERRRAEVSRFVEVYNQALGIKEEIERARGRLAVINDRIDNIEVEENAPAYARLVSPAVQPEGPRTPGGKQPILIVLASVVGALLALVVPVILDFFSTAIRTPGDLHRLLGFAPVGWIPENRGGRHQSLFDDQLDRLGVALLRDVRSAEKGRTYCLTSCETGAGRTMLANSLGDDLSQRGLGVIVVECDPANEGGDFIAPIENLGPGLVDVLGGECTLDNAVVEGGDARADRLPFGSRDRANRLRNAVRLGEVLEQLSAAFDVVIVDSPPLLLSAEAESLVSLCQGALLVVAAERTATKRLRRAAQIIERADPDVVGSILNRAAVFRGGGYYRKLSVGLGEQRTTLEPATGHG